MSSRRPETQKYQPRFFILKRLNISTPSTSSAQVIARLTRWCIFCFLYPFFLCLFILLIYSLFSSLSIDLKDNLIWTAVTTIFFGLAIITISYDVLREFICAEIEVIEEKYSALSVENKRLMELEKSSDNNLRKEQQDFYYARAYVADSDIIEQMNFDSLTPRAYNGKYKNLQEARSYFKKRSTDDQSRGKLRAVITSIKEESWNQLATSAALVTFDLKSVDKEQLNAEPKNNLFLDIYIYLYAWLVSSIDNNIAVDMPYMPVEVIGLHYPDKKRPDIYAYEKAFDFLVQVFEQGIFSELIEDVQCLSPEEIEICQEVSLYLRKLIEMLNNYFEISQRVPIADQRAYTSAENR